MNPVPSDLKQKAIGPVRKRVDQLSYQLEDVKHRLASNQKQMDRLKAYLVTAEKVSSALETLNQELFSKLLKTVEEKITIAFRRSWNSQSRFIRKLVSLGTQRALTFGSNEMGKRKICCLAKVDRLPTL